MNAVWKVFLSMSCSGGLLILALLLGKRFWKDKISRQWQYYSWLIVLLRLLLPFGPETNLLGKTYQAVDQAIGQASFSPWSALAIPDDVPAADDDASASHENSLAGDGAIVRPPQEAKALSTDCIWLIWLAAALGFLIRKITLYQSFMQYIDAGLTPVSDIERLDQLSLLAERAGVKRPMELCVNPLVSSPLLIGFFRPRIVLPRADIAEKDFQYIVLHELTHYKRRDLFYKWLVQTAVCLHWFNPLVYWMSRELTKDCEFSCDEAVLSLVGYDRASDYGKTLLDAMAAVGRPREIPGALSLSENKRLLKERLSAIMNCKKRSRATRAFTGLLTGCAVFAAAFIGVYSEAAAPEPAAGKPSIAGQYKSARQREAGASGKSGVSQAEQYYEAGSLPLFQFAFAQLDEKAQDEWLNRVYTDRRIAFWGVAVGLLDKDSAFIPRYAEKAYENGDAEFFSVLAMRMSQDTLEVWLDRAMEDGKWVFQSLLFHALNRDDELDALEEKQEKEWAEAQNREYQAIGVTIDGKNYYYQGRLVNVFLDARAAQGDRAFCTLNTNPSGTINIKILRNETNEIVGVAYLSEAEIVELLGSDEEEEDWDFSWAEESWDKWDEKEKDQKGEEEYEAWGVTTEGKSRYYQGKLVHIFLDQRPNSSFYVLDRNPSGTINIKILRNETNEIVGVAYLSEAEIEELFGEED